jgi:hypothetical protein
MFAWAAKVGLATKLMDGIPASSADPALQFLDEDLLTFQTKH